MSGIDKPARIGFLNWRVDNLNFTTVESLKNMSLRFERWRFRVTPTKFVKYMECQPKAINNCKNSLLNSLFSFGTANRDWN